MNQLQDLTQVNFCDTLIVDNYSICGVNLKPFCLGHVIILEAINNPLIKEAEENVEIDDGICYFFLALLICSVTYEDGIEMLNNPTLFSKICNEFCDNVIKNMELDPTWNIHTRINMYKNYMANFLQSMPLYNETSEDSGNNNTASGGDWKSSIFIIFKKLGYSQTEILNMNIKNLFMLWAQYAEGEGAIKICNKYEAEQLKKAQLKI